MPTTTIERTARAQYAVSAVLATLVLCLAVRPTNATDLEGSPTDSRQVYSQESPTWLSAVGKLRVPGRKLEDGRRSQHREDCSASLIVGRSSAAADTIITAWHCLEFYGDLSKKIIFTLLPDSGEPVSTEVYRLADGGGMYADWAILRMHKPILIPGVQPLTINPGKPENGASIVMAGYSSDAGLGQSGQLLTYDAHCTITRQSRDSSDSNCRAHRGASGGAVVQLSEDGEVWLSGVISQGDGAGTSTFVPVDGFRSAINRHLNRYQ